MEHLRNLGVADDTLVVFFADNGWLWGEHRLRAKNQPYEESIRAPMFVRYPKLAPLPRVETRFALNIDLAPTFAELAGAGVPLVAGRREPGARARRHAAGRRAGAPTSWPRRWPGSHPWALVRESQWKYTEIAVDAGQSRRRRSSVELYDLVADPYEETNVAAARARRRASTRWRRGCA